MPIIKKCSFCGERIKVSPSKNSKHNFCSRDCYNKFHSKINEFSVCEVCGKKFEITNKSNANRFCSRDCYDKAHSIKNKERKCLTCQKIFIAKTSEDKYCSRDCYDKGRHNMPRGEKHWNWKGGISLEQDHRDSLEYKKWRQAVYERDNFCCTKCGSKYKLNAHHIKSWKNFPKLRYQVSNGITLCEKCHIEYHKKFGYHDDKNL